MKNALLFTKEAPVTTLTVDTTVYIGKNQIRRNVGHNTSLYMVGTVVDEYITLMPGETHEINRNVTHDHHHHHLAYTCERKIAGLVVQTPEMLRASVNNQMPFRIQKILVLDSPSESVRITNFKEHPIEVHITYAVESPAIPKIAIGEALLPSSLTLLEANRGFEILGITNLFDTDMSRFPTLTLTLNSVCYPIELAADGSWCVTIPPNSFQQTGTYFVTAHCDEAEDSVRLEICP